MQNFSQDCFVYQVQNIFSNNGETNLICIMLFLLRETGDLEWDSK